MRLSLYIPCDPDRDPAMGPHERPVVPFTAPVPKGLGVAAAMLGWIPGLNVYVAPFLWEMFARRIDRVCVELGAPPGA